MVSFSHTSILFQARCHYLKHWQPTSRTAIMRQASIIVVVVIIIIIIVIVVVIIIIIIQSIIRGCVSDMVASSYSVGCLCPVKKWALIFACSLRCVRVIKYITSELYLLSHIPPSHYHHHGKLLKSNGHMQCLPGKFRVCGQDDILFLTMSFIQYIMLCIISWHTNLDDCEII